MKLIGLLSQRGSAPALTLPNRVFRADETDAILASMRGADARPQPHAGLVMAWPRDESSCAAAESELEAHTSARYRAREVLHWDDLGDDLSDAVVLIYLVHRRTDLSFAAFEAHYRERHAPLARVHHPGIARYVQNFIDPISSSSAPVDAISELWFRSESDARTRFYRDEPSAHVIGEDVRRFIDLSRGSALAVRPRRA